MRAVCGAVGLVVAVLAALAAPVAACDGPWCDSPDFGSCGNACCRLEWKFKMSPEQVMILLNETITNGGPDNQYSPNMLHQGSRGFAAVPPFQNLVYVGQATHLTTIKKYVDTLNFAILSSKTGTTVNAFSISDVGGAFGDEGQNYANLEDLVTALDAPFSEAIVHGCGHTIKRAYSVYTLAFIAQLLFGFDTLAQIQKVLTAKYTKDTSVPLQLSQDQLSRAASAVAFLLLVLNSLLPNCADEPYFFWFLANLTLRLLLIVLASEINLPGMPFNGPKVLVPLRPGDVRMIATPRTEEGYGSIHT